MPLFSSGISFWPVLVGALVNVVLGFLWYSPWLFGKPWMALMAITPDKMKAAQERGMGKYYAAAFVGALVEVYILAAFINALGIFSFSLGMWVGLLMWVGFIVTVGLGGILWENKPLKLFYINIGYHAVSLALVGGILGSWR